MSVQINGTDHEIGKTLRDLRSKFGEMLSEKFSYYADLETSTCILLHTITKSNPG